VDYRRLFFALWPDDRQREQLRDVLSPLIRQVEGRPVPRANWHVTLVFLGNIPELRVAELTRRAVMVETRPFRLRFDRLVFWPRPRIACLQAFTVPPPLERLVADLAGIGAHFGVELEHTTYRPHVTAVRAARPFEPVTLARPLDLSFSRFELVESVPGRGASAYRPLNQELRHDS